LRRTAYSAQSSLLKAVCHKPVMKTITEQLEILINGGDLSIEQAQGLLDSIFECTVPESQIAAFLTATRMKKITAQELAGFARSLRSHAAAIRVKADNLVDTCGTGGGAVKTSNVSTAAALVAAGAGVYIAKHGNRGITSGCGSADVMEQLGVKIDASPEVVARCIEQAHIGFMFAPAFHPAARFVQPVRKSLGFRTVFNILGPLANPAAVTAQVLGVADEGLMETVAEALMLLGTRYAMVVHSEGLDEISTAAVTKIIELKSGKLVRKELDPAGLGFKCADLSGLKVPDVKASAKLIMDILAGREKSPRRDIVVLNAAAAVIAAGLAGDFKLAVKIADASITSGSGMASLKKLIEISNS